MEITKDLRIAIKAYKNGDKSVFNTIYNESSRYVYVCINNVISGNDNKEDMVQDIMQDRTITADNINKYVVKDYKNSGMYTYTADECKAFYESEEAQND